VKEILSEFFLGDEVRRLVAVLGELADGSDVSFFSSLRVPLELKTLDHSLSKFGHCYSDGFEFGHTQCSGSDF
jgi:hypothetical protein